MNASHSDVSLYELALQTEQAPRPLQISPATFKSLVSTLFDLVIEQSLSAKIWLKFPKGEVWHSEIDRFCQSTPAPYRLYSLHSQREDAEKSEPAGGAGSDPTDAAAEPILSSSVQMIGSEYYPLPLSAESQLRREYFLLVVAHGFSGLVLAHRPRSVRRTKEEADATLPEELQQKHPMLGFCTFDRRVLQPLLDGINRAIAVGQATRSTIDLAQVLVEWDDLEQDDRVSLDSALLGALWRQQIQRQEDLWRSGAIYRRQAESSMTQQQESKTLIDSLRLKDDFLKTMGQELRAPLSTMKTALTLLNSPNLKPPQRQRYLDMLTRECDRQGSLIASVLDLVQLESTDEPAVMEPLRLSDVVPGVVSTYQPLAQEKGVLLAYTVPEELPAVSCVSPWLRQIAIKLLDNGIKYTPTGGQVWVKAKQQGEQVQIEFRDTGVGIPAADLPKIFDRFYRVRQPAVDEISGAGLGLSIVQQLLLRCGGSISVKSKPGEGSTFSVLLPVHAAESP